MSRHYNGPRSASMKYNPSRVAPVAKTKGKRRRRTQTGKTPSGPDPFTGQPVIHFGAHLWPVRGHWQRHVAQWNEVAKTINGRLIVGVVTDESTDTFADVVAALDTRVECFETQNTPEGENPTFRQIIEMVPHGNDDVLLYCHGKGVRHHTAESEAIRLWIEMMHETVVFNQRRVVEKLAEGYKCVGSFRTFSDLPLDPVNGWHYSGTFFAVRSKYIAGLAVKPEYGGVEAWCGDHFNESEAWCEFTDDAELKMGYKIDAMYPALVDAQMQWEADRIGAPRCEQHKRELEWFIEWLNPSDRILVIGSKHGGLEAAIKRRLPDVVTLSIDITAQADNTQPMIHGSSAEPMQQERIRSSGPFDVVFIDGDHTYAGVKADWQFAQSLRPRLIAFHDIADAIKHRREGCEVSRLWQEVRREYDTEEKSVGCGWGGIGIVIDPTSVRAR